MDLNNKHYRSNRPNIHIQNILLNNSRIHILLNAHGTSSRIDHRSDHKTNLKNVSLNILSKLYTSFYNDMQLETSKRSKIRKPEIKNYLETMKMETQIPTYRMQQEQF